MNSHENTQASLMIIYCSDNDSKLPMELRKARLPNLIQTMLVVSNTCNVITHYMRFDCESLQTCLSSCRVPRCLQLGCTFPH